MLIDLNSLKDVFSLKSHTHDVSDLTDTEEVLSSQNSGGSSILYKITVPQQQDFPRFFTIWGYQQDGDNNYYFSLCKMVEKSNGDYEYYFNDLEPEMRLYIAGYDIINDELLPIGDIDITDGVYEYTITNE